MSTTKNLRLSRAFFETLFVLLGWWSFFPARVAGQSLGNNAVYKTSSSKVGSSAFVDASVFTGSPNNDLCGKIFAALASLPPGTFGAVVDARGITNLTCASGTTPWVQGTSTTNPATILLPAGIITVPKTWVLPNATRVVGEGSGASGASVTTLQAPSSGFAGTSMIQFGSSTICPTGCFNVSIEDLSLDGNGNAIGGIINGQAQELSYARRVNLYRLTGVGLKVWNNAVNSGPYSQIRFDTGSSATSASGTICAQILQPSRGVHGLTCISNNTPQAAVTLDTSNTSIEDVQVQGFINGVLIGKTSPAQNDVLINISGGSGVTNVIHICGSVVASPCPSTANTVSDLSIMGIGNAGGATHTIEDDLTNATLSDSNVAMYVIGESLLIGTTTPITAYARFSTSPHVTNWGVGGGSTPPLGSCTTGSIFSYTSGTTVMGTLFVCANGSWMGV
jgi:hypothetical protein